MSRAANTIVGRGFEAASPSRRPPAIDLIVTCRLADEYLWAEALNVGAYDVLAKPFDAAEVNRVVSLAWLHWKDLHQFDCAGVQKTMPAY